MKNASLFLNQKNKEQRNISQIAKELADTEPESQYESAIAMDPR